MSEPLPSGPADPLLQLALMLHAFDESPVAIALTSVDGRLTHANRAFTRLLGYSVDELAATPFNAITHPDDCAAGARLLAESIAGQLVEGHFQKRYIAKDGRTIWAEVHFSLLRGASGEPLHFVTHIIDLSERRGTERKWPTLLEYAAGAALLPAPKACLDAAAPTGSRLVGGQAAGATRDIRTHERESVVVRARLWVGQHIGKQPVDVVIRPVLQEVLQLVDSDCGALYAFDRTLHWIGGAWLPPTAPGPPLPLLPFAECVSLIDKGIEPLDNKEKYRIFVPVRVDGRVVGVVQAAGKRTAYSNDDRDVLEAVGIAVVEAIGRHRAEQMLQATADRLALASDVARIGVWEVDLATGKVSWDDRMFALVGVDPPQPGREREAWRASLAEAARRKHEAAVRKVMKEGGELHSDITVHTPTGQLRILEVHARLHRGHDGRAGRLVGLNIDVTEHRRGEAELRNHRDHLDELVRARTLELDRSNRELEQFAVVASHDLKAPLRTIETLAGLLSTDHASGLDAEGLELLGHIGATAARMQAMTDSLLAFSRLSTRAQPFEGVDLSKIATQSAADLLSSARSVGGRIEVGPLPWAFGDRVQLQQLVQNLMANGLKFARPGVPPVVRVWGELVGQLTRFSVEDNGIGIPPQHRERVFRMFERLHGAHLYEGSGIGLAICKKVVDRHGGTIRIETPDGPGTRIVIELPVG